MPNLQGREKPQPPVNLTKRQQRQDDLAPIHEGKGRSTSSYSIGSITDPSRFDKNTSANKGVSPTKHTGHQSGKGDGSRNPVADSTQRLGSSADPSGTPQGYPAN